MKKLLLPVSIISALFLFAGSGCKEYTRISMPQVEQIYDSLKTIPGVVSMHVMQDDDYSKVTIVLGDVALFNAGKEKVEETASRVGMMVLHVLGPDNNLSKGTFAVSTKDMNETNKIPDGSLTADMKIEELKKTVFPGK